MIVLFWEWRRRSNLLLDVSERSRITDPDEMPLHESPSILNG
jgi:hypothetical protein